VVDRASIGDIGYKTGVEKINVQAVQIVIADLVKCYFALGGNWVTNEWSEENITIHRKN
jgi:hypothetical protein